MTTKTERLESLVPLFERAEEEGLWFYSPYQSLWFSPDELRERQEEGRFMWGPKKWKLRDPIERVEQLYKEAEEATNRLNDFKVRWMGWELKQKEDTNDE